MTKAMVNGIYKLYGTAEIPWVRYTSWAIHAALGTFMVLDNMGVI